MRDGSKLLLNEVWFLVVLLWAIGIPNSQADQNDPRLNVLFEQLHNANNPNVARSLERQIWTIWHESPDPKSLEIMRKARRALDSGEFPVAIELLNQLVDHAPQFAEAWNQRAIVLFLAEDFTGALRDIEEVLKLEPRHFGALSGRGQVHMHLDHLELALEAFSAALESNPWMHMVREQMEMVKARLNARQRTI